MKLDPHPQNPNRFPPDRLAGLAAALAEFGDLSPVVWNKRTGPLVGGHQRVKALEGLTVEATDLPAPEPDGTVARGYVERDGRRYALRVVDWPDDKAAAAMIAANRWGRIGTDDPDMMRDLLALVGDAEGDGGQALAELTGYLAAERERLANQTHQGDDGDATPPGSPRSCVTFPPRVWLTQRTEIVAAIEPVVASFGGTAEWAP